ncbi:MAG: arginine-specific cysteine proteinase RgpB [bacterium F082]|nr:MAG: arginine-specific cysteine proteinase RgpB [bacterium F082]KWW28685.1 MAG: arginine-specific cysteine proteinase RgpB [bacterium P201]
MKKGIILSILLAVGLSLFAQQAAPQWHNILGGQPESYRTQLISSSENSIQVNVQVPGFYTASVTTPRGEAQVITLPKAVSTAHAGEPDMPMTGIPVLIGDKARMSIRVVDAQYRDFEGIEVAPSKGDFPRTINPEDVPYTYGACYSEDAFFPASNIGLYEPYIIRDFRGQNMVLYPFAYNPATKTLRVYYNMTVEMYKVDDNGSNTIESRRSNVVKMDPDFKSVYQRHFINYEASMNRYTPLDEEGDLLIICYDNFISSMTDFVNWKKTRGVNTTIVGTSTAGSTYSAIKTYIQSQYNANNNITHVLLVGDVAQIPGYTYSGGGSSYAGKGDNPYGQVVGNDIYNDIFIGRFSASSTSQVTTQVNRIITYERDLTTSATWCQNGLGISTSAGSGGHNNEDDYQHIENLRTDLMNYGYSTVYQDYYNVSGYPSSSCTTISNHINSGVGIINYCNHGQETGWQSHSPYYTNTYVNALTNDNKLPFIFSVACLVGKYDYSSGDCFGETWMHATNGNNPTGAIGGMFSYISQPWIPPMWAQDEFVDILCELKSNNIKRSLGGAAVNGLFAIFDNYSTTNQSAVGTYQAWVLYGDPTLMLRTKTPQAMNVTHNGNINLGATSYSVTVNNGNGAVATITDADHNILGKATVSGTTANISINGTLTPDTELTLCVFGYNKVTYLGTIDVVGNTNQAVITATANPAEGGTVNGGGVYELGDQCTLTATPNTGYTFTNWKKDNTVVSNDATYTFTVTENATYTATFTAIPQYTVTIAPNTVEGGTVAFGGRGNREELTYDFEDGWQGWTTFQGNTTSPNSWMHNTSYPTSNNNFSTGYGHNSSDGFMLSESYISGSSSGSGTAVTPDNYLVSPQVRLGGSISFYAGARNTSYCAEKFSVVVSTTDNTNAASFTTVATWTLSLSQAGYNDTPYTVDLSAYSGMGYVAIRHFDCTDQWFLCVDDITIVEGEIETGEMSATFYEGETCTVTATPNTGYGFVNWTENAATVSADASYSFAVTADRSLVANFTEVATQTASLIQGSNWWTPTVNVTLEQLEAALGTSGLLINSQDDGFAEYANGSWSGTLTSIEPGKMYKIETNAACSLALTGTAVGNVGITIVSGYNWIGYTGTQAADIATALGSLGITPANDDTITDKDGNTATYNNGWSGTLTTLQPGHGYVYLRQ